MILLFVDALILAAVVLATFLVVRRSFRQFNSNKLDLALDRQKAAEKLAKEVDQLDLVSIKENEKKIQDKLNSL